MAKRKATKKSSALGRATWKGSIKLSSDSMLSIPVKAFTSRLTPPAMKTIHSDCHSPIKQETTCPACGPIEKQDTGKAHEFVKDSIVVFTAEEVDSLKKERDEIFKVACYADAEYLFPSQAKDKTYYLLPESASAQEAYQVFMLALEELRAMAVGEVTITSTTPAAIYPSEGLLKLTLLEYAENVKAAETYASELLDLEIHKKNVVDAKALVRRNKAKKFTWTMFPDTRTREMLAMVERKISAGDVVTPCTDVIDLTDAFKSTGKKKKAKRG